MPKFKYAKFDMHDKGKEKERNVLVDVELCSHDKIKDDMIGWWCNEWAKWVGCFMVAQQLLCSKIANIYGLISSEP